MTADTSETARRMPGLLVLGRSAVVRIGLVPQLVWPGGFVSLATRGIRSVSITFLLCTSHPSSSFNTH